MRGRQLADPGKGGLRRRHILQRQIMVDRGQIGHARHARPGEHSLDLRAEHKPGASTRPIERFFTDAISSQNQTSRAPVPQRQRKHPAQPRKDPRSPGVPAIDDDLGVAAAAKRITQRRQLAAEFCKVVYLAVVGNPDIAISARHRLMAGRREIDDRQSGMGKAGPAVGPHAFVIGPAMPQRLDHPPQPRFELSGPRRCSRSHKTGNSAHFPTLLFKPGFLPRNRGGRPRPPALARTAVLCCRLTPWVRRIGRAPWSCRGIVGE